MRHTTLIWSLSLALLSGLAQRKALAQGAPTLIPGFLKFEAFSGIPGTPVQNLLDDTEKFQANKPDEVLYMTSFDSRTVYPNDSHDNFGARISGVVTPVETGDYEFFLRSDDASQLFLNKSGDAVAGLELIAEETGCCNAFQEPGAAQTSAPITLQAGKAYAIQALYKEGGGGDFCQVAWRKVGDTTPPAQLRPIAGAFLATTIPASGTINVTKQPANVTAAQNDFITLSVEVTASGGPVAIQWQKNGVNVPGLTGPTVIVGPLASADNGAKFRAVVSFPEPPPTALKGF